MGGLADARMMPPQDTMLPGRREIAAWLTADWV